MGLHIPFVFCPVATTKPEGRDTGRLRDERAVSWTLVRSLSSVQGGSDLRISETTGNLHLLQKFAVSGVGIGKINLSINDSLVYVEM